jgi:adenosylhomocysteine nucleosidase
VAGGVVGLVSFGLAGGLNPAWRPGALVIPEAVRDGDAIYLTDAVLRDRFGPANARLLVAGPEIVADAAAKRALFAAEGAVAVDLESGAVGRVARHHGLGFAVLRAICDPAERDLPPAARAALDARGAIGLLGVLVSLAREPGQFAALLRLAGDARRARSALIAVSRRCRAETTPPPG